MAEREGFEPPLGCPKPDFESGAFDHSAISPQILIIAWPSASPPHTKGRTSARGHDCLSRIACASGAIGRTLSAPHVSPEMSPLFRATLHRRCGSLFAHV